MCLSECSNEQYTNMTGDGDTETSDGPAHVQTLIRLNPTSNLATCVDGKIADGSMTMLSAPNRVPLISRDVCLDVSLIVGEMPEEGLEGVPVLAPPLPDSTLGRPNKYKCPQGHACGYDKDHGKTLSVE